MRAWWVYWLTLVVGAALWIGVAIASGRDGLQAALGQPIWALILIAPIALAGINLVVYRRTHEVICRLEVECHHWLALLVGRGYSARTFALTGAALLALSAFLIVWMITGRS